MATCSAKQAKSRIHALITGRPGIGKTTLVRKVAGCLQEKGVSLQGFYTEEVRQHGGGRGRGGRGGPRIGFDVVSLDGHRGVLARVERPPGGGKVATVGRYHVDIHSFEHIALPTLQLQSLRETGTSGACKHAQIRTMVLVIDEIGKMELFSREFADLVRTVFECPDVVVMATIPIAGQRQPHLVEALRRRDDCQLFEVTEQNKDALVSDIERFLSTNLTLHSTTT